MANKSSRLDPEVEELLQLLGLEAHMSKFASENVCDMETLTILTNVDLRDLGLKIGDRAKLRHALMEKREAGDSSRFFAKKRRRASETSSLSADEQKNGKGARNLKIKTPRTTTSNGTGDRGWRLDIPRTKVDHGFIFNGDKAQDPSEEEEDSDNGALADGSSKEMEETVFEEVKGVRIVVTTQVPRELVSSQESMTEIFAKELGFKGIKNKESGLVDIHSVKEDCPYRDELSGAHCSLRRILTMQGDVICNCDEHTMQRTAGLIKSVARPIVLEIDKLIPRRLSGASIQRPARTEEEQEVPFPDFDDEPGEIAGDDDAEKEEEQEVPFPTFNDEPGKVVFETAESGEANHSLNVTPTEDNNDSDDKDRDVWTISVIHEDGAKQEVCLRLSKVKKMKRLLKAVCKENGANPKDAVLVYNDAIVPVDMSPTELGITSGAVLYFHRHRSSLPSVVADS